MKFLSVSDLHGKGEFIERVLNVAPSFDALLFPGDLIDGMVGKTEIQYELVFRMLADLAAMGKPVIFCTGNHDFGLIAYLKKRKDGLPGIVWDGGRLQVGEITIRSHAYNQPCLIDYSDCNILLHHVPPEDCKVAMDEYGNSFGSLDLHTQLEYEPEKLPPLIICGHQHYNEQWHCRLGNSLILNSGQSMRKGILHYFEIYIDQESTRMVHHPSGEVASL